MKRYSELTKQVVEDLQLEKYILVSATVRALTAIRDTMIMYKDDSWQDILRIAREYFREDRGTENNLAYLLFTISSIGSLTPIKFKKFCNEYGINLEEVDYISDIDSDYIN